MGGQGQKVRILQVEDSPLDAELVLTELDQDGIEYETRLVDDEQAYIAALDEFHPDIVLSDLSMPVFSGERALQILRERGSDVPFIFISATLGEEAAIEALRNGATDYILKHNTARLASAVRRALREAEEQRARAARGTGTDSCAAFRKPRACWQAASATTCATCCSRCCLPATRLEDYADDPRLARLGTLVRDCGRRGLEMVSSMLSFARGARRAEQVKLGALLEALNLLLQGSVPRTVRMDVDVFDPDVAFEGNHTELQQCLLNLCLNAIQAMPEGGVLRIETDLVSLPEDFFADGEQAAPGRYLRLSVVDSGHGMPPEVLERLFEPFFTTKETGTGLGLLSCKRIVASHGGLMRVRSQAGEGTAFHLYLPLRSEDGDHIEPQAMDASLQGEAERVLVVVEEAVQLSLLVDTLDAYGYQAGASQSGTAALQWIEAHGVPDLVVMDADMNLFTGVRTLAALLDHGYGGAVLLLARPDAPPNLDELPQLDHLYVIEKPVQSRALLRKVREALEASDGRAR